VQGVSRYQGERLVHQIDECNRKLFGLNQYFFSIAIMILFQLDTELENMLRFCIRGDIGKSLIEEVVFVKLAVCFSFSTIICMKTWALKNGNGAGSDTGRCGQSATRAPHSAVDIAGEI
jgi:hypothetical protein